MQYPGLNHSCRERGREGDRWHPYAESDKFQSAAIASALTCGIIFSSAHFLDRIHKGACVAGTYSTPQQVCEPCPLGQFVEYFGQTECFECWPGTFNDDASTPTVECQAWECELQERVAKLRYKLARHCSSDSIRKATPAEKAAMLCARHVPLGAS